MASWREIERIRKDANGFRSLAASLLAYTAPEALTGWETGFLSDIGTLSADTVEFTIRQSEKLLEIRDSVQQLEKIGRGFSVKLLVSGCYQARLDLPEDDAEWISALHAAEKVSVRRREAGRLLRCAAALDIIDLEAT